MASVWIQLLYRPRHHLRRAADFDPDIDSPPSSARDSDSRGDHRHRHSHSHSHGRHRRQPADHPCRHPCHGGHRAGSESVQSGHVISESGAGIINDVAGVANSTISMPSQIRNYQLPGAVLQARTRLLERLRGASPTPSRLLRQGTTASGIIWGELAVGNDSSFSAYRDPGAETHREQFGSAGPYDGLLSHDAKLKNTSKLNWEAPGSMCRQVCKYSGESDETLEESLECYICLEKLADGDGLVRLNCTHKFHASCLEPWLQTIGNCPCCRANIKY